MKYPIITCYPNHANLISVISQNENYTSWFLNNYIQLFADKNDYKKNLLRLDFYTNNLWQSCPFVYYQKISRQFLSKFNTSIIDFCIEALELSSYIYFLVDVFYISNYQSAYKKWHNVHDIFIYGVDL